MSRLLAALLLTAFSPEGQDRKDLPNVLDTWYRVVQGKRQVGYVHETVKRASLPWRYEYLRDAELELTVKGRPHEEDQAVTALLDESFMPIDLTLEAHVNDGEVLLSLYSTRDERRFEGRPDPAKEPVLWSMPTRDEVYVMPSIALYALRQNELLAKPGRITVRAVDPRGEEKAGIEIVLEVGEEVRRTVLGKEVPGTTVSFLKPFPGSTREMELREAFVDRHGRILEATLVGGAKILMAGSRMEALAEIGPVHRHGRRDPMDKMTAMKNAARERRKAEAGDTILDGPPPTLDSLSSDLVGVQKLLEQVRAQKAAEELDEARKTYLQALLRLKAIRDLAARRRPEMIPDIEKVRDDAELAWDGAAQLAREAGALFVQVEDRMARLDCEGVDQLQRDLLAMRERIEVERRPEREAIAGLAAEVGTLSVKCRTRRELATARLQVTGIMMGEKVTVETIEPVVGIDPVKFVRNFAWAEINGHIYRTGDTIEGTPIRVDRITRHSVQVTLRDEVRDVSLRR